MSSLLQKNCPKCGKRAIKIDRDRFGKRTCECGETWYPTQITEVPAPDPEPTEEGDE